MLGLQASYSYAAGKTGADELIMFLSFAVPLFFVAASKIRVEFNCPFAKFHIHIRQGHTQIHDLVMETDAGQGHAPFRHSAIVVWGIPTCFRFGHISLARARSPKTSGKTSLCFDHSNVVTTRSSQPKSSYQI